MKIPFIKYQKRQWGREIPGSVPENRLKVYNKMLEIAEVNRSLDYQDLLTKARIEIGMPFISISELKELTRGPDIKECLTLAINKIT